MLQNCNRKKKKIKVSQKNFLTDIMLTSRLNKIQYSMLNPKSWQISTKMNLNKFENHSSITNIQKIAQICDKFSVLTMRKKCPYLELFQSALQVKNTFLIEHHWTNVSGKILMNDYESNYVELPEKSRNSATETM